MSLFKVRDFWSFDLEQLQHDCPQQQPQPALAVGSHSYNTAETATLLGDVEDEDNCGYGHLSANVEGNFVASLGQFSAVGCQDVFVCANLSGYIYLIQVPSASQRKFTINRTESDSRSHQDRQRHQRPDGADISSRQLLAVSNLEIPIVDIKCGYFTSALKQSIAVLSFTKLIVYSVKRRHHQIDLISEAYEDSSQLINENLLSHEFEELYKFDLLNSEFASNILVVGSGLSYEGSRHGDGPSAHGGNRQDQITSSASASESPQASVSNEEKTFKHPQPNTGDTKQLHLPQRDKIIVQYTNQFLLTLIESKKIIGHFRVLLEGHMQKQQQQQKLIDDGNLSQRAEQMAENYGPMPMGQLNNSLVSLLVMSFSDQRLYCIPLMELNNLAKRNIMRRVAQNLLQQSASGAARLILGDAGQSQGAHIGSLASAKTDTTTPNAQSVASIIEVDLCNLSKWSLDLVAAPIQMVNVQRHAIAGHNVSATNCSGDRLDVGNGERKLVSQLLVVSRYRLDLFSSSGQHLWSQRFETPLIHVCSYSLPMEASERQLPPMNNLDAAPTSTVARELEQKFVPVDKMICLVCTDCMSNEKSNLVIMEEDCIAWSALLNCKPSQVWRMTLGEMSGFLACLDTGQFGKLSVSYLGTNMESSIQSEADGGDHLGEGEDDQFLAQLEQLDDFSAQADEENGAMQQLGSSEQQQRKGKGAQFLMLDVSLEAAGRWPEVTVESCISIRPSPNSTAVLRNMVATLEFDDSLKFESNRPATTISRGVLQVPLGNCWPDRREPLVVRGCFSLSSSQSSGTQAIDKIDQRQESDGRRADRSQHFAPGLPKSLKVMLYLRFNETYSGAMLQEESFLLPLNLISSLVHIDYSSGQDQELVDVLGNLNSTYKRLGVHASPSLLGQQQSSQHESPYYVCDLLFKSSGGNLLDLIDELIESDLVCRGFNSESPNYRHRSDDRKLATLESINLLAQSLDLRLRYKSPTGMTRQASEDMVPPVVASIALKVRADSNGPLLCPPISSPSALLNCDGEQTQTPDSQVESKNEVVVVWLHICDLSTPDSNVPRELVSLHLQEWMKYSNFHIPSSTTDSDYLNKREAMQSLLIAIECEHLGATLFFQDHLMARLKRNFLPSESSFMMVPKDDLQNSDGNLLQLLEKFNLLAVSLNLHNSLRHVYNSYHSKVSAQYGELKAELAKEYCKFRLAVSTSISLSKRLSSLPESMNSQFKCSMLLTKQYQVKLMKILDQLERIEAIKGIYSRFPNAQNIMIETDDGKIFARQPDFNQLRDL